MYIFLVELANIPIQSPPDLPKPASAQKGIVIINPATFLNRRAALPLGSKLDSIPPLASIPPKPPIQ